MRADGPRRLGGHQRRGDEAVRVHEASRRGRASAATASRSIRTTWPGGRASSTSSIASSSSPATSTSRCRATSSTSSPRRSTTAAGRSRARRSAILGRRLQAERARRPQLARRPMSSPARRARRRRPLPRSARRRRSPTRPGVVRERRRASTTLLGWADVDRRRDGARGDRLGDACTSAPTSSSTPSTARAGTRRASARSCGWGPAGRRARDRRRPAARPAAAGPDDRPRYYEEDPRVRREAESLVAAGRPVQVLGLRQAGRTRRRRRSTASGVHHLDVQRHQGAGLGVYLREYLSFLARAMCRRGPAAPPRAVRARPGPLAARLPRVRGAAAAAGRRAGPARSARGDAGVLPQPLPGRVEPARPSAAACSRSGCRSRRRPRPSRSTTAMRDRLVGLGVPAAKAGVVINSPSLGRFDAGGAPAPRVPRGRPAAAHLHRRADADLRARRRDRGGRPDRRRRPDLDVALRRLRPRRHRPGPGRPGGRPRHRRSGHVPRPHPDRGRARRGRRAPTSAWPRPATTSSPT